MLKGLCSSKYGQTVCKRIVHKSFFPVDRKGQTTFDNDSDHILDCVVLVLIVEAYVDAFLIEDLSAHSKRTNNEFSLRYCCRKEYRDTVKENTAIFGDEVSEYTG